MAVQGLTPANSSGIKVPAAARMLPVDVATDALLVSKLPAPTSTASVTAEANSASAVSPTATTAKTTTSGSSTNTSAGSSASSSTTLSPEALAQISSLSAIDRKVRQHEQAHVSASGGLSVSDASFTYQKGPDGVNYAVGGEVSIDTSPGRTPQETIDRARIIQAAALAPADPSSTDRAVAAQAGQMEAEARSQLAQEQATAAIVDQARNKERESSVQRRYDSGAAPAGQINTYA